MAAERRAGLGALARIIAALIAIAAWAGLGIHLEAQTTASGSALTAIWVIGRYFTVTTNLIVAVAFTLLAINLRVPPRLVGGIVLSIVLVGVVYDLFLHGLHELTAGAAVANVLLHRLTPVVVPLFWLFFLPKGRLQWADPPLWAVYPIAYLGYALLRGSLDGNYAYPFLDVGKLGEGQVAINVVAIAAGFLAAGWVFVWVDSLLGRRVRAKAT